MRPLRFSLALASLLGLMVALIACRGQFGGFLEVAGPTKATPTPTATPTPSPTATPTPTPSPTPNPCTILSVEGSAPVFVDLNQIFTLHVTPSGPAGPQEGPLDYCNAGGNGQPARVVVVESFSGNVKCISSCSKFSQTWQATAKGDYSIRVSVDRMNAPPVTGTVR